MIPMFVRRTPRCNALMNVSEDVCCSLLWARTKELNILNTKSGIVQRVNASGRKNSCNWRAVCKTLSRSAGVVHFRLAGRARAQQVFNSVLFMRRDSLCRKAPETSVNVFTSSRSVASAVTLCLTHKECDGALNDHLSTSVLQAHACWRIPLWSRLWCLQTW
jgi:hypothetical protein